MPKFWAASHYGAMTDKPYVSLLLDDQELTQVDPDVARKIALSILEAADAAESDAFIIRWCRGRMRIDMDKAVLLLQDFRQIRETLREEYKKNATED